MTLEEAKDHIARSEGHADWITLRFRENSTSVELLWEQVAKLYARSKWDEACHLQKEECDAYHQNQGRCNLNIILSYKPEFKP